MPQRIMIVDDDFMFSESVVFLLRRFVDMELVGQFKRGSDALAVIPILRPDILLTDVMMPGMDGITLSSHVRRAYPNIQVIVVTGSMDSRIVDAALEAGASQVIFKDDFFTDIIKLLSPQFASAAR